MARYKIHQESYLHDARHGIARVYKVGEEADVPDETIPGPHMEPLDQPARKAFLKCVNKEGNYEPPKQRKVEEMPLAVFAGFDIGKLQAEAAAG